MSAPRIACSSLLRAVRAEAPSTLRLARPRFHAPRLAVPPAQGALLFPRPCGSLRTFASTPPSLNSKSHQQEQHKREQEEDEEDDEEAQKAKKGTIRERLRYLTRRYGWWALGVYMAASAIDFSVIFASIHMLGAEHIEQLERRVRGYVGLDQRDQDDEEGAEAQPGSGAGSKKGSTIWTEAVLAYTIHKTLLLPFRVAFTAAVTPSFVKYMVRIGWARSHAAVKKATELAAKKKAAAAAAKNV